VYADNRILIQYICVKRFTKHILSPLHSPRRPCLAPGSILLCPDVLEMKISWSIFLFCFQSGPFRQALIFSIYVITFLSFATIQSYMLIQRWKLNQQNHAQSLVKVTDCSSSLTWSNLNSYLAIGVYVYLVALKFLLPETGTNAKKLLCHTYLIWKLWENLSSLLQILDLKNEG